MRYQILSRDDIAAISALHKAGHSTWAISDQTGVTVRQVQRYVKHMAELNGNKIPAKKKLPGYTHNLHDDLEYLSVRDGCDNDYEEHCVWSVATFLIRPKSLKSFWAISFQVFFGLSLRTTNYVILLIQSHSTILSTCANHLSHPLLITGLIHSSPISPQLNVFINTQMFICYHHVNRPTC